MYEVVEYEQALEGIYDRHELERVVAPGLDHETACHLAADYNRQVRGIPGAAHYYVREA
ncbi:hypothetical protein [Streptomyces sp. 5-6(2022)]|uniref:hypothetical protein n=1 Tax=Streptomyces sp. 5-6(2022) TaxID=2936510 RepID=UPI0023B8BDE1|nr:hypothetical protein [Streptomyces sp. 5-6(2022)]